ncbi:hypothetical protein [Burkholderia stagnalis]|uniref:hypothetical protein n=2 Tax=Burkholderia stagnalis TaxID=1503054 RepID=UPI00075BA21B|nr:hypothetical protein [Burkholderia stagnalis]KWC96607.1 hypothetical protein WT46_27560 [Burkholderia stagnalis]KWD04646.1 hypothetical protein WT45_07685 [Burkholderia stagnalis]
MHCAALLNLHKARCVMAKAKSFAIVPRPVDRASDIAELIFQTALVDHALATTRNLSRIYADLTHEVADDTAAITLDAKALRGMMTFFTAQLDEALESLDVVRAMLSQLEKPAV